MLVLSRYRDESIHIGDDVVITVVDIRGDRVRLGISAPSHISVHRQEIYDAIAEGRERPTKRHQESERRVNANLDEKSSKRGAPLTDKLESMRKSNKGLPVDMSDNGLGFASFHDLISQ